MLPEFILQRFRLSFGVLTALLCLPIAVTAYPPLVDLPNHLARAYIEYRYNITPSFQALYERVWMPVPNSASDLTLPLLLRYVSPSVAVRTFLLATVVLFVVGCRMLGRSFHGRPTAGVLLSAFFVYSSALLYGFLNYLFGLALYMVVFAFWLRWRHQWTPGRYVIAVLLVSGTYEAHLSGYVSFAVSAGVVTIVDMLRSGESSRRSILALSPTIPGALAFLLFRPGREHLSLAWGGVRAKLIGVLGLVRTYDVSFDIAVMLAWAAFALWMLSKGRELRVDPGVVVAALVLLVGWLVSPSEVGDWSPVDARFILPAIVLLVLSVDVLAWSRLGRILFVCVLLASLVRVAYIGEMWWTLNQRIQDAVEMLAVLPEDARVYPAFFPSGDLDREKRERGLQHIGHYATISRHAELPTLLAVRGSFVLVFRRKPSYRDPAQGLRSEDLEGYDYVWTYQAPPAAETLLEGSGVRVAARDGFAIWRLSGRRR